MRKMFVLALVSVMHLALMAGNKITGIVIGGNDCSQLTGVSVMLTDTTGRVVKGAATDASGRFEIGIEGGRFIRVAFHIYRLRTTIIGIDQSRRRYRRWLDKTYSVVQYA